MLRQRLAMCPLGLCLLGLSFVSAACALVRAPAPPPIPTPAPAVEKPAVTVPTAVVPVPSVLVTATSVATRSNPDDLLFRVSKTHPIGPNYEPPDLVPLRSPTVPVTRQGILVRQIVLKDLERMVVDASKEGKVLYVLSAYRSYGQQQEVWNAEVRAYGEAVAARQVARPGYSEHQLGTAIDFTSMGVNLDIDQKFADTPEGIWLAQNAYRYGFILSYPKDKEAVTGYIWEPWHYRYVGPIATEIHQSGLTLNEWLDRRS